jgi:integrase
MKFSKQLVRRVWSRKDRSTGSTIASGEYPQWYGRYKGDDDKHWKWQKFFTDKRASEKAWEHFKQEMEQRAAGVILPTMTHAKRAVADHAKDYLAALKLERVGEDHHRIATLMLNKLIDSCGWKRLADITSDSLRIFITDLEAKGLTAEYQRKYISRAKAFVHWLQRDGRVIADTLKAVKRPNAAKAKKKRARKPLEDWEFTAFFGSAPECRKWIYAFPVFQGFRRSEQAALTEGDLRLNAPIPFIQLRGEWTKNDKNDVLPLHPRIAGWLRTVVKGDPESKVFPTIPDMKTMKKDLIQAGVEFTDKRGRRSDFHSLRHTFSTNLDRTGCSHNTKKSLLRHADTDLSDGYTHSRLAELLEAIKRLPFPDVQIEAQAVKTGTDDATDAARRSYTGHSALTTQLLAALGCTSDQSMPSCGFPAENSQLFASPHDVARPDLIQVPTPAILAEMRPSTQVD